MNELMNELIDKKLHYKAIMLVIASYDNIYCNIIETWKTYMNKVNNVKIYLLYNRNDLVEQIVVDEEEGIIFYNCEESFIPGIFLKTIYAMEYCNKKYSYDYLIRTNLSSFYNIPKLINYLDEQPKSNFAGGMQCVSFNIRFISGSGVIISCDLVKKILKSALEDKATELIKNYPDDVLLSCLLSLHINPSTFKEVPCLHISEKLTNEKIELLSNDYFHFRNRNDHTNRILDSQNISLLTKYFYNI